MSDLNECGPNHALTLSDAVQVLSLATTIVRWAADQVENGNAAKAKAELEKIIHVFR